MNLTTTKRGEPQELFGFHEQKIEEKMEHVFGFQVREDAPILVCTKRKTLNRKEKPIFGPVSLLTGSILFFLPIRYS